jgi:hypothetical protein
MPLAVLSRIRPICAIYFNGQVLVGDRENGNIYGYDTETYSDNGEPLPAIRSCVTLQSGLEEQPTMTFTLDMDVGVGLESGDTPQVSLRTSKNGGKTWSNELIRSIGKVGEFDKRVIWNRVGGGRKVVYEVTITDPVKRNIVGAFVS